MDGLLSNRPGLSVDVGRSRLGLVIFVLTMTMAGAGFAVEPSVTKRSASNAGQELDCKDALRSLQSVHPVLAATVGKTTVARLEAAARAHGRGLLLWYAELQDHFVASDASLHPTRRAFIVASSALLRCHHAALAKLSEWQPSRSYSVPTSWAIPGDVLFTEKTACAVFLRGEVFGLPGHRPGATDRVRWEWNGSCPNGLAEGQGEANLVLRSGDLRPGLLGKGFSNASFKSGAMHGLYQLTDDQEDDPNWRAQFQKYSNGRAVSRFMRGPGGALTIIEYVRVGDAYSGHRDR